MFCPPPLSIFLFFSGLKLADQRQHNWTFNALGGHVPRRRPSGQFVQVGIFRLCRVDLLLHYLASPRSCTILRPQSGAKRPQDLLRIGSMGARPHVRPLYQSTGSRTPQLLTTVSGPSTPSAGAFQKAVTASRSTPNRCSTACSTYYRRASLLCF